MFLKGNSKKLMQLKDLENGVYSKVLGMEYRKQQIKLRINFCDFQGFRDATALFPALQDNHRIEGSCDIDAEC